MKKRLPLFKDQILNNVGYKLMALLITLVIWVSILGQKDVIMERVFRVEYLLGPNQKISSSVKKSVKLKVSGPRMALKKFSQLEDTVTINLRNKEKSKLFVDIDKSDFNLPLGVKVLNISPKTSKVNLQVAPKD